MSTPSYLELEHVENAAKSTRKYAAKEIPTGCYVCGSETLRERDGKSRIRTFNGSDNVFHIFTYRLCRGCTGYDGKINVDRLVDAAIRKDENGKPFMDC